MEELERCTKCGNFSLKAFFNKSSSCEDNLHPHCRLCCQIIYNENRDRSKKYFLENFDRYNNNQKLHKVLSRTRISFYEKSRRQTDFNFELPHNIRKKLIKHWNLGMLEKNSTFHLLGCSSSFSKKGSFIIYLMNWQKKVPYRKKIIVIHFQKLTCPMNKIYLNLVME